VRISGIALIAAEQPQSGIKVVFRIFHDGDMEQKGGGEI